MKTFVADENFLTITSWHLKNAVEHSQREIYDLLSLHARSQFFSFETAFAIYINEKHIFPTAQSIHMF